jgi:DNA-directed RNA polymerase subunit E'/Rpb7
LATQVPSPDWAQALVPTARDKAVARTERVEGKCIVYMNFIISIVEVKSVERNEIKILSI